MKMKEKDIRRRKMKNVFVKVRKEERKKEIEAKGLIARQMRKCIHSFIIT
jgi:hypothetical protein